VYASNALADNRALAADANSLAAWQGKAMTLRALGA